MKIQWGMMMTDGRGKLGGQVASKNRAGAYIRTKVTPTNPQTASQSVVRSVFSALSKQWSEVLADSQRKKWNHAAGSGEFAKNDVFGNSRNPSGFNLFVGMNSLQNATSGRPLTVPPLKAIFLETLSTQLAVQAGATSVISGLVELADGNIPATTRLQIQATPMVSAGKSYAKNLFRDIGFVSAQSGNNTLVLADEYEAKFGAIEGSEGKQLFVRVRQVFDGQHTPWVTMSAIVQPEP